MIPVLPPESLTTTFSTIEQFSSRACTALIYDEYDIDRQVVLFPFDPKTSRGRINMISWWMLQMMTNVPVTACWLIEVERDFLTPHWPDVAWPESLICFAAEAPSGQSPMSIRNKPNSVLANSLNEWPELPQAIALHEIAGNFAQIGIVRTGRTQYWLFDGAGTFGGERWTVQQLRSFHNPNNPLAHLSGWCDAVGRITEGVEQNVMAHACTLTKIQELEFYLNGMLPRECAKAASQFLRTRSDLGLSRWNLRLASNG